MKHLDLTYILENVTDDTVFIKELLGVFLREVQTDVAALEHSIETNDLNQIKRDSHKVKSSFRSLGMTEMTNRLQEIENLGSTQGEISEIKALFVNFKSNMPDVLEDVRTYIA